MILKFFYKDFIDTYIFAPWISKMYSLQKINIDTTTRCLQQKIVCAVNMQI